MTSHCYMAKHCHEIVSSMEPCLTEDISIVSCHETIISSHEPIVLNHETIVSWHEMKKTLREKNDETTEGKLRAFRSLVGKVLGRNSFLRIS